LFVRIYTYNNYLLYSLNFVFQPVQLFPLFAQFGRIGAPDLVHVGQKFKTRFKEHIRNIRFNKK
jgi:hypothetical protein